VLLCRKWLFDVVVVVDANPTMTTNASNADVANARRAGFFHEDRVSSIISSLWETFQRDAQKSL
jgi:hypothetical protein